MKTIVYIHGLNSSHLSFRYAQYRLPEHKVISIDYDSHQPLAKSLSKITGILEQLSSPASLVGHSLGGVIAALLAAKNPELIENLITISAPHGGSKAATFVRWIPGYPPVMNDIIPTSEFIQGIAALDLKLPTLNIISTGGHLNSTSEPNDSVVTIRSQKALQFGRKIEVKANHFEILMHDKMIDNVRKQVFGGSQ